MKNSLSHLLPALALLTLGGCAGTSALSTTENDGVYYSSKDRTVQNATAAAAGTAPAEELQSDGEISNPDYAAQGQRSSTVTESTEYYDDDYAYSSRIRRFHQPYYRGFGYGGYGGYGYGGYGGYGYGGYGGYNNYYGNNNYYGGGSIGTSRNVRYGPREGRSAEAGTAGRPISTGTGAGRGRVSEGGVANPTGGRAATDGVVGNGATTLPGRSRTRVSEAGAVGGVPSGVAPANQASQIGRVRDVREQQTNDAKVIDQINSSGNTGQPATYGTRSRRRISEVSGTDAATSQPRYQQSRRSRFSDLSTTPNSSGQTVEQPTRRQRTYQAPQQTYETPQRTYQAPQRTYEAPQRSYDAPSRSSAPSGGGGNGGGGRGRGRN